MILTAHQPVFLPWLGFFAKLAAADMFCVFDDVPLEYHSYANRVQVKTAQGAQWLTVPVQLQGHTTKPIRMVEIAPGNWKHKHLRTLELAYGKAPYFARYFEPLAQIYAKDWRYLAGLNAALLNWLLAELGISLPIVIASEQDFAGHKSELVLDMCKKLGATRYIFGAKGRDYADVQAFRAAGVEPVFQDYSHPVYRQQWGEFVPGLSVVDLLFNEGPRALKMLY